MLSALSFFCFSAFAADPSFSITPNSGTQLKLYCAYNFGIVIVPGGQSYNGFDSTLMFDNINTNIVHQSINSFFTSTTSGFVTNSSLYRAYGVRPGGSSSSALTATNFIFRSTNNILSTTLQFATRTGGAIVFDPNTTDDGAVINSSISSLDILSGVTNVSYSFVPLPCIIDNESPLLSNINPNNGARYISSGQTISFLLYDWAGPGIAAGIAPMTNTNNRSHYRFSGLDTSNLSNYQDAPDSVDNQEGVNSGSIAVTISCSTCTGGGWSYTLTPSTLTLLPRTGTNTIQQYTRNSKTRGYTVNFVSPTPYGYEVEKEITLNIIASDNSNEIGVVHTGSFTTKFNTPVAPNITINSPIDGAIFIDPKTQVLTFAVSDDRAGIDTGSISITISPIFSGTDLLYTGATYSGSDLSFSLISGMPGLGNSGSYEISLAPYRNFPENTTIHISGSVSDLAGNISTDNWQFTTRPGCSFRGCSTIFGIDILGGNDAGIYDFTGTIVIVTGTNINSPYPYLTGINNDILMCGQPYLGTTIQSNIGIYDTNDLSINGMLYSGNELYLTGMDGISFNFNNGVIVITTE